MMKTEEEIAEMACDCNFWKLNDVMLHLGENPTPTSFPFFKWNIFKWIAYWILRKWIDDEMYYASSIACFKALRGIVGEKQVCRYWQTHREYMGDFVKTEEEWEKFWNDCYPNGYPFEQHHK
jgi:hypothetical protein